MDSNLTFVLNLSLTVEISYRCFIGLEVGSRLISIFLMIKWVKNLIFLKIGFIAYYISFLPSELVDKKNIRISVDGISLLVFQF